MEIVISKKVTCAQLGNLDFINTFYIKSKNAHTISNCLLYHLSDKISLKTVCLTSRMLKVYAENLISGGSHTDGNLSTISLDNKSRANVLFQMPMYKVRTKVETRKPSLFKSTLISVISIKSCATSQCIELIFDQQKDRPSFSEWNRYIKESEDILDSKINRLGHIQMSLKDKTTRRRRSRSV